MSDRTTKRTKRARSAGATKSDGSPRAKPKRADGTSRFIRDGGDAAALTDLGCPDCRGVLSVDDRGPGGFLSFRCRVGHAFSLESLVPLKEDRLEDALWTAVELCDELASLHHYIADRAEATTKTAAAAQRRMIDRMRRHSKQLREIVADAPLGRPRSRRT